MLADAASVKKPAVTRGVKPGDLSEENFKELAFFENVCDDWTGCSPSF